MSKQRKYYGLITFDEGQFTWSFGSYDKSDVTYERQDMHDHGYKLKNMTVITFAKCPRQSEIEYIISNMNANMID